MTLKNGLFILLLTLSLSTVARTAQAMTFPDQEVANAPSEDENSDAVSSFGNFNTQRRPTEKAAKPLAPIAESSFASDAGRAPASATSRAPAGIGERPKVVEVEGQVSTSKKAIERHAQQSKSFQEVAIIANDLGFFPSTLFLTQGIPVRLYITGASQKSQCFMLDDFGVRRQIRNQKIEEITFTPDQTGTFSFNCPMNGAKGTVVVKEIEVGMHDKRVPASVQTSHAESSVPIPAAKDKNADIHDEDFGPEFRN